MEQLHRLRVFFTIERRGTQFFFRNATHSTHIWHGPYADTDELSGLLTHYMREQLLDEFDLERLP